jgi:TRAP-type C4-dicarboxylate transport system permease small subunit
MEMAQARGWMGFFVRLDGGIAWIERFVLAGGILMMAAVSIANVIGRNFFDHSLAFAEEINQLLTILITFLGLGYGVRHGRHIRMSAFYDQLQGWARKALMVVICLVTGVLLLAMAWYAVGYVRDAEGVGSVTPALRIPLYLIYLWVPIGLALGGVQFLLAVVRNLTTPGVHLSFQEEEKYEEVSVGAEVPISEDGAFEDGALEDGSSEDPGRDG